MEARSTLGASVEKRLCLRSVTPVLKPGCSEESAGRFLRAEGGSEVPSVGCGSVTQLRSLKRLRMAERVAFCSATAAEEPGCSGREEYASQRQRL